MLVANEWDNQSEVLKQHALPLVSVSICGCVTLAKIWDMLIEVG